MILKIPFDDDKQRNIFAFETLILSNWVFNSIYQPIQKEIYVKLKFVLKWVFLIIVCYAKETDFIKVQASSLVMARIFV